MMPDKERLSYQRQGSRPGSPFPAPQGPVIVETADTKSTENESPFPGLTGLEKGLN